MSFSVEEKLTINAILSASKTWSLHIKCRGIAPFELLSTPPIDREKKRHTTEKIKTPSPSKPWTRTERYPPARFPFPNRKLPRTQVNPFPWSRTFRFVTVVCSRPICPICTLIHYIRSSLLLWSCLFARFGDLNRAAPPPDNRTIFTTIGYARGSSFCGFTVFFL